MAHSVFLYRARYSGDSRSQEGTSRGSYSRKTRIKDVSHGEKQIGVWNLFDPN